MDHAVRLYGGLAEHSGHCYGLTVLWLLQFAWVRLLGLMTL